MTTILTSGCHPFITLTSSVVYEESLLLSASAVRAGVGAIYSFNASDILSPAEVARVQAGIEQSELMPEEFREYARKLGVI